MKECIDCGEEDLLDVHQFSWEYCLGFEEGETVQERADRTNPYLLTTEKEGE
jgi:hypothetical protein